jgi:lysophospholipase L1-like esterase
VKTFRFLLPPVFGLLVALLVLEVCVRVFLTSSGTGSAWSDRPAFYYSHEKAEFLRDTAYEPEKPTGVYRIAVVGDSFSFAPYMQFDDTFPKRLERILNLQSDQPRVEVRNYGVPRYSTNHEIALVERALREGADLILLQITLNDPEIKPYRPTGLVADQVNRFGQLELTGGIYRYWKTAAFVRTRLFNAESRRTYIQYFQDLFTDPKTRRNFTDSLDTIETLAKQKGVPLVGVLFPLYGLPLDASYPFANLHTEVAEILKARSIQMLDLLPAFQGIPVERMQVIPGNDFHPNEIGHRIAAEWILRWLANREVLPAAIIPQSLYRERTDIRRPDAPTYSLREELSS